MAPKTSSEAGYAQALQSIALCHKLGGKALSLNGLQLSRLPPEIGQLTALTHFTLSNNQLSTLPPEIGQLTALTHLTLENNQLSTLPPEISLLTALTHLTLSNNQLRILPSEIGCLLALEWLDLSINHLNRLPSEIGCLARLRTLCLSHNFRCTLPTEISRLAALKTLALFGNQLGSIPPEIFHLEALTTLGLDFNALSTLPSEIGKLVGLQRLDLNSNQLSTLPLEIGQLKDLKELDIRNNRFHSWPDSLTPISSLRRIRIHGNPLPKELLILSGGLNGVGTKLLRFLRMRAAAQHSGYSAALERFDEAKLLLVGPGNVGKTWLLHALQGKVPQKIESTKGIEIAREPLDVSHPTVPDRTLHMTCWDFGGQEHFQVTHQIFFSAKAVYLLVWKPREGFDPEMENRLERIQLSAGDSARVLIVSTHADGKIPAIIGQEALKERFGALIWGFYQVDSAKGPAGTGIAELQVEIARATAQLEGMDLDYPATWHAAQRAIRQIKEPAVPFKRIVEECKKHKLDAATGDILAQLMEVQGHAVYFPDAASDEEAGALADENIIVLSPEWLAKAVGFVIEDKETIADQGVLSHNRLAEIWKKDPKRDCPGYKKQLRGYLLWLMWKFDIAYKQDAQTSLVPELIARNRPDDLLWTPKSQAQSREVQAVCVFTSEQTGKMIASPKGMMSALTAATHPLRQHRDVHDPDKLDRNWNNGFFLNTERRGDAYVELVDRELQIVIRHEYPALLLHQVLRTIEGLVPQRWPHAVLDLRVPCRGKLKDKPCPGNFKIDWLMAHRRSSKVRCQECGADDLKVAELLEGFHQRESEVLDSLKKLKDGQKDLLAAAHSLFIAVDPSNEERRSGPSLFTILPEKGKWVSKLAHHHVRLTCWCEHPDGPHPGTPIGSDLPPDYVLKVPKDWLVKTSPYFSWAVMLLKAFTPLSGDIAGQISGTAGMDLKDALALMKNAAGALPSGKLEIGEGRAFDVAVDEKWGDAYSRQTRPELTALRHIHDLLEEQVSKPKRWGNLSPVLTKSGDILWLCPQHAAIQSPPPQKL